MLHVALGVLQRGGSTMCIYIYRYTPYTNSVSRKNSREANCTRARRRTLNEQPQDSRGCNMGQRSWTSSKWVLYICNVAGAAASLSRYALEVPSPLGSWRFPFFRSFFLSFFFFGSVRVIIAPLCSLFEAWY